MAADGESFLELRGWTLSQRRPVGQVPLLSGLDLTLRPGAWIAVAGANGSGKSSLLTFLAGAGSPLHVPVALLPQDPDDQFVAATVAGELALGREGSVAAPAGFGLESLLDADPRLLSAGQKQRLALAVALGAAPRVLLCDEPTALQDARQATWVLDRLDAWRRETGGCLLTATCDRREALRADEILVLEGGRVAARGAPSRILEDAAWASLFDDGDGESAANGGEPRSRTGRSGDRPPDEVPVLSLRGVACRFSVEGFAGVDLDLRRGDRLGICGPNGCGKSTLLAVCAGARKPDAGEVRLGTHRLYSRGAQDTSHGRALLAPQFPEYLFSRSTVAREIAVDPALAQVDAAAFAADLGLPPDAGGRHPRDLSSGQRRRLALGLVLLSGRPLLLLDEPTVALDGPGRRLVRRLLADVSPATALVVASHDQRFLEAIGCDVLALGPAGLYDA
jgi:energy-coupling factor transporter ATP-binding protein EcfA2